MVKKLTKSHNHIVNEQGAVLILAILFLVVATITAIILINNVTFFQAFTGKSNKIEQALNAAEAGIDKAVFELNKDPNYCPSNPCENATQLKIGSLVVAEFDVEMSTIDSKTKKITAIGYAPNKDKYTAKKIVSVIAKGQGGTYSYNLDYAVHVNFGDIHITGGRIEGDVFSNSQIICDSPRDIEGDAYTVVGFGGSDASDCVDTGYSQFSGQSPQPLPNIDVDPFKDAATAGGTITGPVTYSSDTVIGPKKYDGDLNITGGTTDITIAGPIYVTGNLFIDGADLYLDSTQFVNEGTAIVVDGEITINGNADLQYSIIQNIPPPFMLLISTKVGGTILTGSNANLRGTLVYAPNTTVALDGNADALAIIAEGVRVAIGNDIIYNPLIDNFTFTTDPGGGGGPISWSLQAGTYKIE